MTWNAAFPTQNTQISQSTGQIQVNWGYIATTVGKDHYFNTGTMNDGHHQFVQFVDQVAVPASAVSSVAATVTVSGLSRIQFRSGALVPNYLQMSQEGTQVIAGAGTNLLHDFTGFPAFYGMFLVQDFASVANIAVAAVYWSGAALSMLQIGVGGAITALSLAGTTIQITTTGAMTAVYAFSVNIP